MKAAFLDFATVRSDQLDITSLESAVSSLAVHEHTSNDQVATRIADCELVVTNKFRMTAEVLDSAPTLKLIALIATGTDNIDLVAAGERGIAVCNIRAYCTNSVVEHVFGVLLQMTRNIGRYNQQVRNGDWRNADVFCMLDFPLRELSAMTLGIVGYGELGSSVARVAEAFGMQVKIARRIGLPAKDGDGRVDMDELLSTCDVVSLHCPLTKETESLIGERELMCMRANSMLINTARGGLVDSEALVDALRSGQIAAAAIDVLQEEPPVNGDPLLDYKGSNLIVTPHIAWATVEARQNAIDEVAANIIAFDRGEKLNRVV